MKRVAFSKSSQVSEISEDRACEIRADQQQAVAEAFSRKALVYDEFGQGHPNLERMRQRVRSHVLDFLRPGERMLELNAGTGADAAFFASLGFRVHATDLSPGMVARIEEKIERLGLSEWLSAQRCSFLDLEDVRGGPYQYAFSNMGGVNCVQDLQAITAGLGQLLSPGARVTWVVMPPFCPWELLAALRGDFKTTTRRLRPGGVLANVEGQHFMTYYFTPRQVQRAFGMRYHPLRLEGLGIFTPPADHKDFAHKHPRQYAVLGRLDDRLCTWPVLRGWGDFFVLTLEYRGECGD